MTTTHHDPTVLVQLPADCPFGVGPIFEVIVRSDVMSRHGNVFVPRGRYQARRSEMSNDGDFITVWSPNHYAGPIYASVPPWQWSLPGEMPPPMPKHDCMDPDTLRSGVVGDGLYCGVCNRRVA